MSWAEQAHRKLLLSCLSSPCTKDLTRSLPDWIILWLLHAPAASEISGTVHSPLLLQVLHTEMESYWGKLEFQASYEGLSPGPVYPGTQSHRNILQTVVVLQPVLPSSAELEGSWEDSTAPCPRWEWVWSSLPSLLPAPLRRLVWCL